MIENLKNEYYQLENKQAKEKYSNNPKGILKSIKKFIKNSTLTEASTWGVL